MLTKTQKQNLRKLSRDEKEARKKDRLDFSLEATDRKQAIMDRLISRKDEKGIDRYLKAWRLGDEADLKRWEKEYGEEKKIKPVKAMRWKPIKAMRLKSIKAMRVN